MLEHAFLGVYCHAAEVADMLMTAGGHVEQRCLSAVRIADQSHLYAPATLFGEGVHLPFQPRTVSLKGRQVLA